MNQSQAFKLLDFINLYSTELMYVVLFEILFDQRV